MTPPKKSPSRAVGKKAASAQKKSVATGGKKAAAGRPVRRNLSEPAGYTSTRTAHKQEQAEDYVELIAALIAEKGEARAVDMARALGVSHVTVIRTLARLQKIGLIDTQPYRAVFLTDEGRRLAEIAHERHQVVRDFLLAIGVSREIADIDSEGIEHHVSPETLDVFRKVIRKTKAASAS